MDHWIRSVHVGGSDDVRLGWSNVQLLRVVQTDQF